MQYSNTEAVFETFHIYVFTYIYLYSKLYIYMYKTFEIRLLNLNTTLPEKLIL